MENIDDIKNKIISFIKIIGPSLPMQVAKQIEKNSIIASAFLSGLYSEKEIRISSMKVGGSPLYFLPGQEVMLEKFSQYLPQKEKEALALLQKNSLLKDEELPPAIRVALRNLKDFAFPLFLRQQDKQTIFWHYLTLPEQEAKAKIEELVTSSDKQIVKLKIKQIPKPEIKQIAKLITKPEIKIKQTLKISPIKEKTREETQRPLIDINQPQIKTKKEKSKSNFVNNIIAFLEKEDIELLEEVSARKKEFSGLVRINTDLGKLNLLCIAKEKKKITENDLKLALQNAQAQKMPALIISSAELNKKAQDYLKEHENLIKLIKLD